MSFEEFGPLKHLIGEWYGEQGMDVAPEPAGDEISDYFETIVYQPVGDVDNADEQELWAVHYHQIVTRKSDNKVYHNQTGYWIWEPARELVMHSFTIPRAVGVRAGGTCKTDGDTSILEVSARLDDPEWGIVQSPFMAEKASSQEFTQTLRIGPDALSYKQTTVVNIYGRTFDHTDGNALTRV